MYSEGVGMQERLVQFPLFVASHKEVFVVCWLLRTVICVQQMFQCIVVLCHEADAHFYSLFCCIVLRHIHMQNTIVPEFRFLAGVALPPSSL